MRATATSSINHVEAARLALSLGPLGARLKVKNPAAPAVRREIVYRIHD